MALRDNLVSWWELNETSGNRADSHGSNTLTDVNTVGYGTGKQGNGADLIATNSEYFTRALGSTGLELTTSFTVAFWMKADSVTGFKGIYMSGQQTNFWRIGISSTTPKLTFTENDIADYKGATTLSAGTWYHCVIVKSGDSGTNLTIYLNGASDGTASVGTVATPTGTAVIGAYTTNASTFSLYFDGILDEFGIWSRALDSTEISELYNSGNGLSYADTDAPAATFVPRVSFIM